MTQDQTILFTLFGVVFIGLIWGRFRYDLVAFSALMAGIVLGVVPVDDAFVGFGNEATIVVALVLIVSAGLTRAGAVMLITRKFVDTGRSLGAHIAIMGTIGGVLSAFMNNVAALALLMPVDIAAAKKAGRSAGLSLMPLSFATILGGMMTLIGTPPNIIIASIRKEQLGSSYGMFDFAPVGAITAAAGIAFVALIGWRLIPRQEAPAEAGAEAIFLAELTIPEDSPLVGQTVEAAFDEADRVGVEIVAILRDGQRHTSPRTDVALEAGDVVMIEAAAERLDEFRSSMKVRFASKDRARYLEPEKAGLVLVEAVVRSDARIRGKTTEAVGLLWRHNSALVGISRQGTRIAGLLRKTTIHTGDILLLLVPRDSADEVIRWLGALPLAERGLTLTRVDRTWIAIGLFVAAVVAASIGWLSLPVALGIVVIGYVLFDILPVTELYDHVEWPVIVLLGSMIPLGTALQTTGGTDLIAATLTSLTADAPIWVAILLLMVATMALSDVLNNTATAIVAAPVGIAMAQTLDVSPDPFLMAVAIASSSAFLTPIGHKNNMLILGPGRYRFGDYWRMGLPLEILVIAVSMPAILAFWPL